MRVRLLPVAALVVLALAVLVLLLGLEVCKKMYLPVTVEDGDLIFIKNKSLIRTLTILPFGIIRSGRFLKKADVFSKDAEEKEAESEENVDEKMLNLHDLILKRYREVLAKNSSETIPKIEKCSVSDVENLFEVLHRNLLERKKDLLSNLYFSLSEIYSPTFTLDLIDDYFKKEIDQVLEYYFVAKLLIVCIICIYIKNYYFQLLDEWKGLTEKVKACQKEFEKQEAPEDIHRAVCRHSKREYSPYFQRELIKYLEFHSDLRGFWRCLKIAQKGENSSLKHFLVLHCKSLIEDSDQDQVNKKRKQ